MIGRKKGIEPLNIGRFDLSDAFVNADRDTYKEMQHVILESGVQNKSVPLGDSINYFENRGELGAQIITSFLSRVATDASGLIRPGKPIEDYPARVHIPALDTVSYAGELHRDGRQEDVRIGVRYLITNSFPTLVHGIDTLSSGDIARLSNTRTFHQKPSFSATREKPRVRFSVDI